MLFTPSHRQEAPATLCTGSAKAASQSNVRTAMLLVIRMMSNPLLASHEEVGVVPFFHRSTEKESERQLSGNVLILIRCAISSTTFRCMVNRVWNFCTLLGTFREVFSDLLRLLARKMLYYDAVLRR